MRAKLYLDARGRERRRRAVNHVSECVYTRHPRHPRRVRVRDLASINTEAHLFHVLCRDHFQLFQQTRVCIHYFGVREYFFRSPPFPLVILPTSDTDAYAGSSTSQRSSKLRVNLAPPPSLLIYANLALHINSRVTSELPGCSS